MKTKTKLISWLVVWAWLLAISFADDQPAMEVQFCNWGSPVSSIDAQFQSGVESKLCMQSFNRSNSSVDVQMYVVDMKLSPEWFKSCNILEDPKNDFAKFGYLTDDSGNKIETKTFTLAPNETKTFDVTALFPADFKWQSLWCVITTTWKFNPVDWKLNIQLRRWSAIKATVWSDPAPASQSTSVWAPKPATQEPAPKPVTPATGVVTPEQSLTNALSTASDIAWSKTQVNMQAATPEQIESLVNKVAWKIPQQVEEILAKKLSNVDNSEKVKQLLNENRINFKNDISEALVATKLWEWELQASVTGLPTSLIEIIKNADWKSYLAISVSFIVWTLILILLWYAWLAAWNRRFKLEDLVEVYEVNKWDTLESIAAKFGCNWKEIAVINSISAPYKIGEWDEIKVLNLASVIWDPVKATTPHVTKTVVKKTTKKVTKKKA